MRLRLAQKIVRNPKSYSSDQLYQARARIWRWNLNGPLYKLAKEGYRVADFMRFNPNDVVGAYTLWQQLLPKLKKDWYPEYWDQAAYDFHLQSEYSVQNAWKEIYEEICYYSDRWHTMKIAAVEYKFRKLLEAK